MSRLPFTLLLAGLLLFPVSAIAQIIPDSTLGNESTQVNPDTINGIPSDRLSGGAIRGVNLFHSFREFNVGEGRGAYFSNPAGISNIFTRVTGGKISNILGTLGVLGNANLFLINPNGIVFGSNSRLDLRGSFIGSTADSVVFDNGDAFSANNPSVPLLNINIPIGLNFRETPGSIVNQSQVNQAVQGTEIPVGLAVPSGQTLALLGGEVNLTGNVTAFQGNILLGSVASPGLVSFGLTPTGLTLDYAGIQKFGTIQLSGTASATASGEGGGAISVRGGNVTLRDRANLVSDTIGTLNGRDITVDSAQLRIFDLAFISTLTKGTGTGGNIAVRAADSIELKGTGIEDFRRLNTDAALNGTVNLSSRQSGLIVATLGAGRSGNITVDSRQLTLQNGAIINNPTVGTGVGGNVTIRAAESVDISESGVFAPVLNQGNGGTLTIDTGQLTIRDGGIVSTSTLGAGSGGDIILKASDSIIVSQSRAEAPNGATIATNSIGGTGNAGNVEINTGSLLVEKGTKITSTSGIITSIKLIPSAGRGGNITITASDSVKVSGTLNTDPSARSLIAAGTIASGQGGNVIVNARRLTVDGGAGIGASALGAGDGGNVTINASESVEISGVNTIRYTTGIATASGDPLTQNSLGLNPPTGAAGNLSIVTSRLNVRNGATVSVGSVGTGRAGSISIVADAIALDTGGSIDGTTLLGAGANINLLSQDIQLRRGGSITTNAGSADGGNIAIDTETLAALENSDITANAKAGRGGQVIINATGIFGTEFRQQETPKSDITATSDLGASFSGTVEISTPDVDPSSGLVQLAQNVVDVTGLIGQNPCSQSQESEFIITGKGGLPANPVEFLTSAATVVDWATLEDSYANAEGKMNELPIPNLPLLLPNPIMPARGWVFNDKGDVVLTSYVPTDTNASRESIAPATCGDR